MGVDVGTDGSKGVITDLRGRVLAHQAIQNETSSPRPGWYEHDADEIWWDGLCQISRALLQEACVDPKDIAGLGVSALCPDMLPVDEDGRPLRPGILYGIDTRAQEEINWISDKLGPDLIFEKTANPISAQSVGPKILWFQRHEPDLYARTHQIHTASSYLVYRLTGSSVVDCGTALFFTPLLDIQMLDWDEEVCRAIGVDRDLLPRVAFSTDLAGEVTEQAASATGLAAGTPVIVGCCDASAEAVSVGAIAPGDAALTYGSTMCLVCSVAGVKPHPSLFFYPHVVPGIYGMGAGMATSASLTRWYRNNFAQVEVETERLLGLSAYQLLSDQAAEVPPGCEGLVVLPYFAGERTPIWDSQARGLIAGLTLSHSRAHLYRALYEGTAYGLRHNLDAMAEAGAEVIRMIATGGGTRSKVWTQIISDVTGYPQELAASPYGSPYGGAYLAGYGVGLFRDFEPLRQEWVKIVRRVEPNPDLKPLYDEYYQIYLRLYEHTKEEMHALARLSDESNDSRGRNNAPRSGACSE
jgi:xylulokinase